MRSFKDHLLDSSIPKIYLYLAIILLGLPSCTRSEEEPGEVAITGRAQWTSPRVTKIPSPKPGTKIRFGDPVLVYGNEVYAGADHDGPGAMYIYSRAGSSWGPPFRLTSSDGKKGEQFGNPARSKDLLISASGSGHGAAYLFKRSGSKWKEIGKLTAANNGPGRGYEYPAIDTDTIAIGSVGWYDPKNPLFDHGALYILERTGTKWVEQQILFPSYKGAGWLGFGLTNDIDGDIVITSAHKENGWTGAAYVFGRQGTQWKQEARLVPTDLKLDDTFGGDLALDGDTAVVAASGHDAMGTGSGAVYVFDRSGTKWLQSQKILPKDLKPKSFFGSSVDIDGKYMAVGALGDSNLGPYAGAVYIFEKQSTKWVQKYKIYAPGGKSKDSFGYSISIDYPLVAVTAFEPISAAIYIIELNVLVSHDGGPPGGPDLSLDLAPPPDASVPDVHDDIVPDLPDSSDLPLASDSQPPATDPGCSCTLARRNQMDHFILIVLFAGACLFLFRRRNKEAGQLRLRK